MLGPSCPLPLARLPRVNALLHSELGRRFPSHYAQRLAEARASPTQALLARVQAHSTRLVLRPCLGLRSYRREGRGRVPPELALGEGREDGEATAAAAATEEEEDEEGEGEGAILLPLLTHLRVSLPFLLALVLALALPPASSPAGRLLNSKGGGTNGFALLLASTPGTHWLVWSFLEATLQGRAHASLQQLTGFRHLLADTKLRLALATAFPPGLSFACTWLLLG